MAPSATSIKESSKGIKRLNFTTFANVINGHLVTTAKTRHGINPATKTPLPEVPISTEQDLDDAVGAARVAFRKWSRTPLSKRRATLEAFAVALESYETEFANMLTTEQGKPIHTATAEAQSGPAWIRGINKIEVHDEVIEEKDRKVVLRHTPLGVVGAIVPWNFPIQTLIGKIAPALVTGNTIIVKPSPFTPYCALKIVELAQQFFPPGVLQGLSGDDSLGPWMTAHPNIDKISFTGSTATGKKVMEVASKTLKRLTLELGGKDPAIICKDVNIALVAPKIAQLAFLNSGQICIALKRIYIHESIYDEFRAAMVEATKKMQVGDGFTDGIFLGPIQNEMQYDRVRGFFDDIEKEGQRVAVGGIIEKSTGYFIKPTIIDNPAETSRLVLEEPFGPILPIMPWSTEDEVIERANNTQMGLGASVWTKDMVQGERIAQQLEAGNVWVNAHLEVAPAFPFGGHKQSGIGTEWGTAGLKSFYNTQTLYVKKEP
ncbi:aldehyde dehydrogenase [Stipitochalara longipes BDJ]|nr:aldehyde dehydrogenase [Stipitochalara longipes BDJ]